MADELDKAKEDIKDLKKQIEELQKPLATAKGLFKEMGDNFAPFNSASLSASKIISSMSGAMGLFGPAGQIATQAVRGLIGEMNVLGQFVGKFRPDVIARLTRAMDDLYASIGEQLVPVLQLGTRAIRWIADTVVSMTADILPQIKNLISAGQPLADMLTGLVKSFVDAMPIQEYFQMLGSYLAFVTENVKALLPALQTLGEVYQSLQKLIWGIAKTVIETLGPIVAVVASILGSLLQIIVLPFRVLMAVLGPLIQLALLPLTVAFKVLAVLLQPLVAVLGFVAQVAGAVAGAFDGIGKAMGAVIGAVVGVIGRFFDAFKPLWALLATVGKVIGGLLSDIGKTVGDLAGLLAGLISEIMGVFADLFKPLADMFKDGVTYVVAQLTLLAKKLREWINDIREFFGLPELKDKDAGDSKGKAAVQAQFTDQNRIWQEMVKSTFGAGRGEDERKSNEVKRTNYLEEIRDFIRDDIKPWIEHQKQRAEAVTQGASTVASAVSPGATGIAYLIDMWRRSEIGGRR